MLTGGKYLGLLFKILTFLEELKPKEDKKMRDNRRKKTNIVLNHQPISSLPIFFLFSEMETHYESKSIKFHTLYDMISHV